MWKRALLLFPILLLTACSEYHPLRGGIGYTDVPVGPQSFEVTYAGAAGRSLSETRQYCLFRAAEISVLHGAPYFRILVEHVYVGYGEQYFPGEWDPMFDGGWGRHRMWSYYYEPGYIERYTMPEVAMRIELASAPGTNTIPAAYLISKAVEKHVKLKPGVIERAAGMPSEATTIPAPPPPQPRPAQ